MKKHRILLISILFLFSCSKEYPLDINALRDERLFGTWEHIEDGKVELRLVYTAEGYFSVISESELNLDHYDPYTEEIWHNEDLYHDDVEGEIYYKYRYKSWQNMGYDYTEKYRFSANNDSLWLGDCLYTKSPVQYHFNGPDYVGCDSVKQ